MPSPINTFPRGLLGLLGVQTGGRTPQELAESVGATLEMFPFYSLSSAENFFDATGAIPAAPLGPYPNLFGVLTVPQFEQWYVHRFTIQGSVVLPAGETHGVSPALFTIGPAGAGLTQWQLFPHSTFGPGQMPFLKSIEGFWMKPGNRLGVFINSLVAGSGTVAYELRALVTKIAI